MIILIDNYDSFTYNIYHYLLHFTDNVKVIKNTERLDALKRLSVDALVLSPGPSHPKHSNLTLDAIDFFKGKVPMLGICLGMQAIGYYFGSVIRKASKIMHGKLDNITHSQSPIFKDMADVLSVVRYHSLVVDSPKELEVVAKSLSDSEIMAVENADLNIFGIQFHPESYMTKNGIQIIKNFLGVVYD